MVYAAKYAVISNNKCYGKLLYTDWNQKRYSVMTFWARACMEKLTAAFIYGNVPVGTVQTPSGAGASTHRVLPPSLI